MHDELPKPPPPASSTASGAGSRQPVTATLPRDRRASLSLIAAWMGERFYRTFHPVGEDDRSPFDARLLQRERSIGVTFASLWEGDERPPGGEELERLVATDLDDDGAYALWVPPGAALPLDEPRRSEFRLLVSRGLTGLEPNERREVRIPAVLQLAKVDAGGAYVSVAGGLAAHWTRISEGVEGAYHLDSRALHRLPEEPAELDIIVSLVRDRAALLNVEEVSAVDVHDHWLVSRLPDGGPPGLTVIGAPPSVAGRDGSVVRRLLRRAAQRAAEQRGAGDVEFSALVLLAPLAHIEDEMATAALRGMNPTTYGAIDLIALIADGQVRQVLQPRSLPWEQ